MEKLRYETFKSKCIQTAQSNVREKLNRTYQEEANKAMNTYAGYLRVPSIPKGAEVSDLGHLFALPAPLNATPPEPEALGLPLSCTMKEAMATMWSNDILAKLDLTPEPSEQPPPTLQQLTKQVKDAIEVLEDRIRALLGLLALAIHQVGTNREDKRSRQIQDGLVFAVGHRHPGSIFVNGVH